MSKIIGDLTPRCVRGQAPLTGITSCMKFEGRPLGFIFTGFNDRFLLTTEIVETLRNKIRMQTRPGATIVISGLVNLEPTGGDIRLNQEGWGAASINGLNPLTEVYTINEGGLCLYKELRKLNGRKLRVILIDADWLGYFTSIQSNNEMYLRGFSIRLGVTRRKNIETTPGAILLTFVYDTAFEQEDENIASIQLSSDLQGMVGLKFMRKTTTATTIEGTLVTSCDNSPVPEAIIDEVTASIIRLSGANGEDIVPTAVTSVGGVVTITVPVDPPVDTATVPIKILEENNPTDWIEAYMIGDDTFHV